MIRKILYAIAALLTVYTSVCAADDNMIYTEYKTYKANIYVCDTNNKQVIMRNVQPVKMSDGLHNARALEYTAVAVNENGLYERNGNRLTLDVINGYLLDREVTVVVGRNRYGYRVLYMSI